LPQTLPDAAGRATWSATRTHRAKYRG
jgi:hypothetical protein